MEFEFFFKSKLAAKGLTVTKFAEIIGTSPQNLTQKIKRGSISYIEMLEYAEKLGYKIEWIDK